MTTLADLVNQVSLNLHGFSDDQESRTHLTAAIAAGDLTLPVDDASGISAGLIELDDELMWVTGTDVANKTVTVAPYGRGYGGSVAASHAQYAQVMSSPRWPRTAIKGAINQVINQVYPTLYAVKTTTTTAVSTRAKYDLPVDAEGILALSWQLTGPSHEWMPLRRWRYDSLANTDDFTTGRAVSIFDNMTPGRAIQVVYFARPTTLSANTDTLVGTGLQASCEDVLVYGATARLIQQYEASRLQLSSVTETERSQFIQAGSATNASRAMYALFSQRLAEERSRLLSLYPTPVHYTH